MKDIKFYVEIVGVFLGIIASVFAAFFFMDARHAKQAVEYELKSEILDLDIKKDAENISYYNNKKNVDGELHPAEVSRKQYLEAEMERKIDKKNLIEQKILDME